MNSRVMIAGILALVPFFAYAERDSGAHGADHSQHRAMLQQTRYVRTENHYEIPNVVLTDSHGKKRALRALLAEDDAVLLQFIFTTCSTICPVLSASFSSAQDQLQAQEPDYKLVSISIDPEHDTPSVLRRYAKRFNAAENWHFLTGPTEHIERVLRAFDAVYSANNKMYHLPYTYLRARPGRHWVRIEGLLNRAELVDEYRKLRKDQGTGTMNLHREKTGPDN